VNEGVVLGNDVAGNNKLVRAGHESVKKAKHTSPHKDYEDNTTTNKDGTEIFPAGHSPGIGHDEPPQA